MANAPKAAVLPPALSEPPSSPVSGIQPARKAIAPTLTEEPKGLAPEKAFIERQKAAIAKHTGEAQRAQDEAATDGATTPPKGAVPARSSDPSSNGSSPKPTTPAGKSTDSKPSEAAATSGSAAPGATDASKPAKAVESSSAEPAEHRYTLQSLKQWAENDPEAAAEVLTKLGRLSVDTATDWIKLKNGERKVRARIREENEKGITEARTEREAAENAKAAIDQAAGKLAPIADLWEAVAESVAANPENPRIDFEAADAAFLENAKISIDDYMRLRARRSMGSSADAVKLRAENARLRRENAGKPSDAIKTTAAAASTSTEKEAEPAAAAAKAKSAKDWSDELPEKHKLRQLEGWNKLLDAEMRKYHDSDTGDYDANPEAIADAILKRQLELMAEEFEEAAPAPRARPAPSAAPKPKPKPVGGVPDASELTPRQRAEPKVESIGDDDVKIAGMTFAQRQARALKRHEMRRRGELE